MLPVCEELCVFNFTGLRLPENTGKDGCMVSSIVGEVIATMWLRRLLLNPSYVYIVCS